MSAEIETGLHTIKGYAAAIDAEADRLLTLLGEPPVDPPIEPPEPEPGDDRNWALDAVWGGPIGSGGRKKVVGKVWDGKKISGLEENTDYVDCIHRNYSDPDGYGWGDTIPKHVRFVNLLVKNVDLEYWAYINHGHSEEKNKLWLAIDGLRFEQARFKAALEIKGSIYLLKNLVVGADCSMNQLLRKRHGRQAVLCGGDAKGKEISFRGWCDWADAKNAKAVGNAGNLESRSVDWEEDHIADGGNNMQREEGLYLGPNLTSGKLGYMSNGTCDKYPCIDTIMHPDIEGNVSVVGPEKGKKPGTFADYLALWQAYGLTG